MAAANAQVPAPTNAELMRLLEAARSELAEIGEGQQRLVRAVERLAERCERAA